MVHSAVIGFVFSALYMDECVKTIDLMQGTTDQMLVGAAVTLLGLMTMSLVFVKWIMFEDWKEDREGFENFK